MYKPELLLPVGQIESFYAALEGGADAVYLGVGDFNARKRAKNFTLRQLPVLLSLARKYKVKVYITLNTVLKNNELPLLYKILHQINQYKPNAVIVQDWAVFYLIKKNFAKLEIHLSTQAAFHNSMGVNFAETAGIKRVVLARELSLNELKQIRKKTNTELEVFVHGALCYSFSGMCLFSSYLGGMSANRGECKQVCRRAFKTDSGKQFIFNLKDNQLVEYVPEFAQMGVNSLKIEGRLKSSEYVYTVAKAYRKVLDDHRKVDEARILLERDTGREKTSYFMGGNVSEAITQIPNNGFYTGEVVKVYDNGFDFSSKIDADEISRIRISSIDGNVQNTVALKDFKTTGSIISVKGLEQGIKLIEGNGVYIVGFNTKKFASRLPKPNEDRLLYPSPGEIKYRLQNLIKPKRNYQPKLYLRFDSLKWINHFEPPMADFTILNLNKKDWELITSNTRSLWRFKSQLIFELPKIIFEDNIDFYRNKIRFLQQNGVRNFMLSHVSQLAFFKKDVNLLANENIYTFSDVAIIQLKEFGFNAHVFPFENDYINLVNGNDRSGIIPVYFYPQLFTSRMPAGKVKANDIITDDGNKQFKIVKRDGLSITIPSNPVCLFHEKKKLIDKGFSRFLIDFSYSEPDQAFMINTLEQFNTGQKPELSGTFNFKRGLN
ncbi:MAG: U32 family peptidase [Bacteroidales bacterium]|nr:U32 family peptidase [Bacteroidales bacterium]MBN2818944.1 U32 family peptidase [Bacteroidales bacterium]